MPMRTESPSGARYLSTSRSSPNPHKKPSSEFSKTYKHASQLYLTRRLPEAYETLQPVIKPSGESNGHASEDDDEPISAPIARATTSQRIKIWSLYAALLNAIVDLGAEAGKQEFGQKLYREIVRIVQTGDVWEQVVQDGYRGREGSLDAEVVYNVSTLLLGKAQTQELNQARLETYLSSSAAQSGLDVSNLQDSIPNGHRSQLSGASTPKDLTSRIKIIELFTLHVLPANNEWEYARSFISNSDILDEERREAFHQTLTELREVKEQEEQAIDEDYGDDYEDAVETPQTEISGPPSHAPQNGGYKGHQRTSSEVDYGIETEHPIGTRLQSPSATSTQPAMTSVPPQPEPEPTSQPAHSPSRPTHLSPPSQTPRRPPRRSKAQAQSGLRAQARHLYTALSNLVRNLAGGMTANPTAMFRMLVFMFAFLMAFSRREIRERVRLVVGKGWAKVRGTVGMGVKVSYI